MYVAYGISSYADDYTKTGFKTVQEAEEYIKDYCCKDCNQQVIQGYEEYIYTDDNGNEIVDKMDRDTIMWTACGAEWDIITQEDYEKYESPVNYLEAEYELAKQEGRVLYNGGEK